MRPKPSTPSVLSASSTPPQLRALPPALLERRVRLRDVPRERDEQADRVLRGRDDGRLGRVRDDDPAPRRRLDVDVVDADARAADHLQPVGARDQLGGQLRRRADDDRVVAADRLREVRVARRRRRRSAPAGAGRRRRRSARGRGRAGARSHARGLRRTPRARAETATPRSNSTPASTRPSSTAASAVVMSKTSNQPMWPMRKILPFSVALAADELDRRGRPAGGAGSRRRRGPSGARIAVTTAERSSSGEKSSRPIAFTPARQARPRRTWRSNAASSPSSRIMPERDVSSASTSGTAGVNGASSFACPFRVRSQSKTKRGSRAAGGRARARPARPTRRTRPGRRHQRLLRARDDHVDAPRVRLERHGAEARDGVDDDERARVASPTSASAWTSATTPVEVSEWVEEDGSAPPPTRASAPRRSSGCGRLAPRVAQRRRRRPPYARAIVDPALAEVARGDDRRCGRPARRGSRPRTRTRPCPRR